MWPAAALALILAWGCGGTVEEPARLEADPAYRAGIESWKERRDERLRAEDGWLTLVGLFWLEEGSNRFGSGPENDLVFPAAAPERAGAFEVAGSEVTLVAWRASSSVFYVRPGSPEGSSTPEPRKHARSYLPNTPSATHL